MDKLLEKFATQLPIVFVGFSIIYAWLLITQNSFPYFGSAFLFASLGSITFVCKKQKTIYDRVSYYCILILAFFLFNRSNPTLIFLDIVGILFLGALLLLPELERVHIIDFVFAPIIVFFRTLAQKNVFPYKLPPVFKKDFNTEKTYQEHIGAIFLTGIILIIVIPLLSYANPFFNKLVTDILNFFNIEHLLKSLFGDQLFIVGIRGVIFLIFMFFLPKLASYAHSEKDAIEKSHTQTVHFLIPKIVLSAVLFVFFIAQMQLYFSTPATLQTMGYTNSQYTREVFAQLSIVAFIVFLIVYADRTRKKWPHILTYVLILESFFLTGMALKSVYDYTAAFGFTFKRLYGYAEVIWIFGLFVLYLVHYYKSSAFRLFLQQAVVFSSIVLIGINIVNFDYLIYHSAKTTLPWGVDNEYLSRLSPDAESYAAHLPQGVKDLQTADQFDYKKLYVSITLANIEYLQKKYHTFPELGAFNFAEYKEYQRVKDINVKYYKDMVNKKTSQLSFDQNPPQVFIASPSAIIEHEVPVQ